MTPELLTPIFIYGAVVGVSLGRLLVGMLRKASDDDGSDGK